MDTIRKECQLPAIFLTAQFEKTTLERAGQTEVFGYIMKPFEDRELSKQIEMALHKHAAEQSLREREARVKNAGSFCRR